MSIYMFYGLLCAVLLSILQGYSIEPAYDGPRPHHHYDAQWGRLEL